jgi:hypothetical protein
VIHDQRECGILVLDGAKVRAACIPETSKHPCAPLRDRSRVLADATVAAAFSDGWQCLLRSLPGTQGVVEHNELFGNAFAQIEVLTASTAHCPRAHSTALHSC